MLPSSTRPLTRRFRALQLSRWKLRSPALSEADEAISGTGFTHANCGLLLYGAALQRCINLPLLALKGHGFSHAAPQRNVLSLSNAKDTPSAILPSQLSLSSAPPEPTTPLRSTSPLPLPWYAQSFGLRQRLTNFDDGQKGVELS